MSTYDISLQSQFPDIIIPRNIVRTILANIGEFRQSTNEQVVCNNLALLQENFEHTDALCYEAFYAVVFAGSAIQAFLQTSRTRGSEEPTSPGGNGGVTIRDVINLLERGLPPHWEVTWSVEHNHETRHLTAEAVDYNSLRTQQQPTSSATPALPPPPPTTTTTAPSTPPLTTTAAPPSPVAPDEPELEQQSPEADDEADSQSLSDTAVEDDIYELESSSNERQTTPTAQPRSSPAIPTSRTPTPRATSIPRPTFAPGSATPRRVSRSSTPAPPTTPTPTPTPAPTATATPPPPTPTPAPTATATPPPPTRPASPTPTPRPLDEDLATRVVKYYVRDIWAVLKTSKNYMEVDRVVLRDFENTVTLHHSTVDTRRSYFRFVFPVPTLRIVDVVDTYVNGVSFGTIRNVLIRHAYIYFMANMFMVGRVAEAKAFHDVLERRFFATLHIMPLL
ncbi:uncharacterized protein EV154DRAFT_487144 [Mucor mucedo]|uniref:uncharacterized protein n=1 Tax=Mucor mucedo TaxID=29922 RepID=UPI00221E849D|nr:uncharacterized protein EV154DRAFT_487144 [Mucor mucedo]KAI7873575.1 hypothetical protein EV154DRAFT_487144 [Mucor mucedo]